MIDWNAVTILATVFFGTMGVLIAILNSPMRKAKAERFKMQHAKETLDVTTIDRINARLEALESRITAQEERVNEIAEDSRFMKRLISDQSSD